MAIATLGRPHRVFYESKNLVSGLTTIKAYVLRPDLSRVGPYSLAEVADVKFTGVYFFDLSTSLSDPPGEYMVVIESPSENNYRTMVKIVVSDSDVKLDLISGKTNLLPTDPASDTVVIDRTQLILDDLIDVVRLDDLSNISGVFNYQAKMSTVFNNTTNKHEIMCWLERNSSRLLDTTTCRVEFHKSDGTLVWQKNQASPNLDGFFKVLSDPIVLQVDQNYYTLITIKDGDGVDHTTTLPTFTVG